MMMKAIRIRKKNKKNTPDYLCTVDTKRCFSNKLSPHYHYEYFGENTPVCCATHLYTILKDVTRVLEENNLEYFISFGTLLGAVRHGGLIPWDTDVDIVVPEKDKEKIYKILTEKLDVHYLVKEDREDNIVGSLIRVYFSKENSLHVDLFTYIDEGKEVITFGYNRTFLKTDIYPLQKIRFYETELFSPQNTNKQLETFYGKDYMKYAYKQWAMNKSQFILQEYTPAKIAI